MRNLYALDVDRYRDRSDDTIRWFGTVGDDTCGRFFVPIPDRPDEARLCVIAAAGGGWDHVSVSLPGRTPTWEEMEHVKRLFFHSYEVAMQLHVRPSDHVSFHPYCLHLWRPHASTGSIPLPPSVMVAPRMQAGK